MSYFKEELTKHYKNDPNADNKIKKLFYSLMYYITNLFPIIYKFDEAGKIIDYSDEFSSFKLVELLQYEINKLSKYFDFKEKNEVEDLLDNNRNESKLLLVELVSRILSKY